ncbi:urease accessory protein UreE [Myroides sp. 1354]|uniref:urease accessory protein UreE n=1 Tax=unclassified Myroides TaxID=2642485 RepID=UPI0025788E44|nr:MULTISPECIES: urease accessory protein UreE [unclassified Myroides]MDM1044658.1 urease accessory protein UreE [Myroides sp. R163-1]MDM1055371.1 urease accessory protein UreE [Myroides sp. 1354]MDM1068668.1 urease accessory protein UreE [Myroides sp. 1372]
MEPLINIDEIQVQQDVIAGVDLFEIEWFETQKHLFKRLTKGGVKLQVEKQQHPVWQQGDALYSKGKLIAQVIIKPTLAIQFTSKQSDLIVDFTYYIGNRHLPIFIDVEDHAFLVPYDGPLYEQLTAKFTLDLTLVKKQLLFRMLLHEKHAQL